jgi:hypothetical protein
MKHGMMRRTRRPSRIAHWKSGKRAKYEKAMSRLGEQRWTRNADGSVTVDTLLGYAYIGRHPK